MDMPMDLSKSSAQYRAVEAARDECTKLEEDIKKLEKSLKELSDYGDLLRQHTKDSEMKRQLTELRIDEYRKHVSSHADDV
jgi:prefoldin subunit 5